MTQPLISDQPGIRMESAVEWHSQGIEWEKLGKYKKAITCFGKAIKINPKYKEAWFNKGVALGQLGRGVDAVVCFEKAIEIDLEYKEAWRNRGVALGQLGRHEQALRCHEKAINIHPEYKEAWYSKGVALGQLGRHEEAIICYEKAIEIDPEYYKDAWFNKGSRLGQLGRHDEALICFEKAIEIDPEYREAWRNKGLSLAQLGRHEEALIWYDKAEQLDPKDKEIWFSKGCSFGELGRHEEALICYERAEELAPEYKEIWFNKGFSFGELGRHDETLICYERAIELDPEYKDAWFNKGFSFGELGRHDQAVICYEKVLEIDPEDEYVESVCNLERQAKEHEDAKNAISTAQAIVGGLRGFKSSSYNLETSLKVAQAAYEGDKYSRAMHYATRCIAEAEGLRQECDQLVSSIESEIKNIRNCGVKISKSQNLIKEARSKLERGNLGKSKELASQAKSIALERKEKYEDALKSVCSAEAMIKEVKSAGMLVSTSEEIWENAFASFNQGHYDEARRLTKKALEEAKIIQRYEATYALARAKSLVNGAKEFGCPVSEGEDWLKKAEFAFGEGSYSDALGCAVEAEESARSVKAESKPEITIELSQKEFELNVWNGIEVSIFNRGNAHAEDLRIGFLLRGAELRGLEEIIPRMNAGGQQSVTVGFKPREEGQFPVDAEISYKDVEGEEYKTRQSFWLNVEPIAEEALKLRREL